MLLCWFALLGVNLLDREDCIEMEVILVNGLEYWLYPLHTLWIALLCLAADLTRDSPTVKILKWKPLVSLGDISYAVYVIHIVRCVASRLFPLCPLPVARCLLWLQ